MSLGKLEINSHIHPYRVIESSGVAEALREVVAPQMPFFLIDRKVAGLYRTEIASVVPDNRVHLIDATEESKSYESLTLVFCWLLDSKCQRSSTLVVIGGGVLQDIGCFIASVLVRGIRWTLFPTTLLAQCDSCIGSKSSLNINRFKNQLGTFYPPHEVRMVFAFLRSLEHQEILSGLGEAIKLHLIDGEESVSRLRERLPRVGAEPSVLPGIVWDSLLIKKRFIEEDEFDRGIRNLLNYGHTFAHAYESATHYRIPHGIAVSLGVASATFFSERLGMVGTGYFGELREWLRPFFEGHESTLRAAGLTDVLSAMKLDKKNQGDTITFILTRGAGKMEKARLGINEVQPLLQEAIAAL